MPAILLALGSLLLQLAGSLAGRVLVGLGIGVVTYSGINASLTWLKSQAVAQFSGLSPDVLAMLGVMRVGNCISILFSAILVRMMLNGVASDTYKRWVKK